MAGQATPFAVHGHMADADMLLLVEMTLEADHIAGLVEQGHIFRGMGVVAGEAVACLEGLMLHSAPFLHAFRIMALAAQLIRSHVSPERLLRVDIFMAGVALPACNRIVDAGLKELGLAG